MGRRSSYRWAIFAVLAAQYLVAYFHRVSPAIVADDLARSFHSGAAGVGLLASGYFYAYALMQVPVGLLSDSLGPRKTITFSCLLSALGSVLFGCAPGYGLALFSRILVGIGTSAVFVSSMKVIAEWFRGNEYGRVSGLLMAVGGVGFFTAATPLALLSETMSWRGAFVSVGAVTLLVTAATWYVVVDRPSQRGLPSPHGDGAGAAPRRRREDLKSVAKNRHFWCIAVWFIFRGGALYAFLGLWAGPFLMEVLGLSRANAGNILSFVALSMIVGSPLIGHLSDVTLRSRKKVLVGSSLLHCACWLALLTLDGSPGMLWLSVIFFFMGMTTASIGTIAITAGKELFPGAMAGTSIGMLNVFPFLGGVLFQPLMGWVLDRARLAGLSAAAGHRTILWVFFFSSVAALVSILFLRETFKTAGGEMKGPERTSSGRPS